MSTFLPLTIVGLVAGCIYAITAAGLVVTYTTTGIFNFAHGAIGMIAAFAYWDLSVNHHWPVPLALIAVLFVIAPALGALIERILMRPAGTALDVTLTITLGLLLFLIGAATLVWDPKTPRIVPQFFTGHSLKVAGVVISAHQWIVVGVAAVVAISLRLFLFNTKPGTTMRAVVDDPELLGLAGARPARYQQMGWAVGAMLAALAGILLAPVVTLGITTLTLLVINGYAAAMVGRLRNLPLTFAGGLALGLVESYLVGYLPVGTTLSQIKPVVPMAFLLLALLVFPERRLTGRSLSIRPPRVPGLRESLIASGAFIVLAWIVSAFLSDSNIQTASHGVTIGIIMLSLVILTGYGGQVSLCQMTFAGLGALAMGRVAGGGSWFGIAAAVVVAAVIGTLVALPALRLRGLYLALATLAFADAMDYAAFQNLHTFGTSGALAIKRPNLPGISLQSDRAFLVFVCVVFCLVAIGVLALRRGPFGRRLVAMSGSPAAAATLGMGVTVTKVLVFALAAGLAGLGGALYGGQQHLVGANDFQLLLSLTLILLAVVWGIRTTSGMLLGGLLFAIFPVLQTHLPALHDLAYLGTGLAAIGIGRNPNGALGGNTPAQKRRERRAAAAVAEAERAMNEEASTPAPGVQPYVAG